MALITVTGLPCSGKTTRVNQLKTFFEAKLSKSSYEGPVRRVVILSDDTLGIGRTVYDDTQTEKVARASLFSATQRCLAKDTILILDGLNYIKGFRYQLHCAVKEAKLRSCTLYVATPLELCCDWNVNRHRGLCYSTETLKSLSPRFEEPSSMVRWDSPLFTVTWSDESIPYDGIWNAITNGNLAQPNAATVPIVMAPMSALYALESTTAQIVNAIMQTLSGGVIGEAVRLTVTEKLQVPIKLPQRTITIAELQRAKRQFVTLHKKAITLGSAGNGEIDWSEEKIAEKFVYYLEEFVGRPK